MSASSLPFASSSVRTSIVSRGRGRSRRLAAVIFLIGLGILTATSLLAAGDEWPLARAREHASPVNSGPGDPHC